MEARQLRHFKHAGMISIRDDTHTLWGMCYKTIVTQHVGESNVRESESGDNSSCWRVSYKKGVLLFEMNILFLMS